MRTRITERYFTDLDALLAAMPPGQIDQRQIDAHERHYGHHFSDPPETVHQYLLDQQRRAQATGRYGQGVPG